MKPLVAHIPAPEPPEAPDTGTPDAPRRPPRENPTVPGEIPPVPSETPTPIDDPKPPPPMRDPPPDERPNPRRYRAVEGPVMRSGRTQSSYCDSLT
jgi:hypothetical protein